MNPLPTATDQSLAHTEPPLKKTKGGLASWGFWQRACYHPQWLNRGRESHTMIYAKKGVSTATNEYQVSHKCQQSLNKGEAVVPAASSSASSRACVSGSTVLRSTPSVALDKSNSDAVFMMGLSRSSWSKMNDSTFERQERNIHMSFMFLISNYRKNSPSISW